MRIRNAALLSSMILILGACKVDSVNAPMLQSPSPSDPAFARVLKDCPANHECWDPVSSPPIEPDLDTIATNCPEACGIKQLGGVGLYFTRDADHRLFDAIAIDCPDTKDTVTWLSSHGCWDCKWGCAGTRCPNGKDCITVPGMDDWDCRAVDCGGWTAYAQLIGDGSGRAVPKCMRPKDNGSAPGAPVTYASVLNGNPYLSWDGVAGAAAYRVYRQLHWQAAPEVWYTWLNATSYHDGSTNVSGSPQSQPNPTWDKWVRYHVVSLSADGIESGYVNVHYYYGSGPY